MAITYKTGLTDVQKQGIESLVSSGRTFNETDAKNYAYATGAGDYNQFLGKTGSQITVPSSVSADSMTTGSTFKTVPGVNPADPTPYVQSLADATSQAQKDFQALQKSSAESSGVNTLTTERTGLTGRLQDALSKLTGKGTALQTAEADLGVPQDLSRLKELNLQMTNLTNEYNKRIASIPGQGIGLTNQAVGQLTDREKRMAAVEIGGLAAVQSALQGNIALSQQQADRTVQMQFEPIEQEIKNLQIQLDLNYDNLSRAEKKQADELSFVLQERQAQVDQAKEDRLAVINMASEAAQQGADTVTLNKILKAGTIEDALAIAGDSLGAGFRAQQEQQNFENDLALRDQTFEENNEDTKPPTQAELSALGFAERATTADEIIDSLADVGASATGLISGKGWFPNILKSADRQQLEQAQRNFVNAVLRKESGASITPDEFKNASEQYFPQAGDTKEVIEQKAKNRKQVIDNLYREGGSVPNDFPTKINLAKSQGYTSSQIVNFLSSDPNVSRKIQEAKTNGYNDDEIVTYLQSFNSPLSMGVKSSDVSKIKDGAKVVNAFGTGIATGIQAGSSKWKWGLDFVLSGGKGASVLAPFSGTVIAAANNKGFGNQVKIKLADGSEMWISHLDAINVKPGQKITSGMIIGKQGNTGALLSSSGQELTAAQRAAGRGTHLDITVKKPDGKYMTSQQVASLLGTRIS